MKRFLLCFLLIWSFAAKAQVYNNEWIDYTKTYYKFKVGKTGLYRISQAALNSIGLGSVPAEQFQLWRNGAQVPVYTSVATGSIPSNGYIEFWGEMNDGKPDKALYRDPDYQLNDKWSLLTDTAMYFLTVNAAGNNARLATIANNVSGNTLAPEPYFMYKVGNYFRDRINEGFAVNVDGHYFYSSSYDKGEGWSSGDIGTNASHSFSFNNLHVYSAGPASSFNIAVSGNAILHRNYRVKINNDSITGGSVDFFNYARGNANFSTSLIASGSANIEVTNVCNEPGCPDYDRMVIHKYELTYPRQFDFGGTANFEFTLPANSTGNYLEISNFSSGSSVPVLYDLTNGQRYVADVSGSLVRVVLQPSATERRLVLVNEDASNINSISGFETRNFINYNTAANQGNYLIISNSLLFNGANGGNPVEDYRAYRSTAQGGGYEAKIYLVDQLVDQFGFGIKKSPLAIQNFIRFARNRFSTAPKSVFLLGRGVTYNGQRYNESNADIDKLNLVPTFGWPASDILLSAEQGSSIPQTPIGRLSAITPQEVSLYLKKVKDLEQIQKISSPLIQDKVWMKNVVHIVGSNDPSLQSLLDTYMNSYKDIIADTLFGANVTTFSKTSASEVEQLNSKDLQNLFAEGISLITYFGHSSSSALAFNLDNPENYNNFQKYPLFIALGCDVGDYYNFNTSRFQLKQSVSEKFVLTQDRGTIGFIASSHFGIVNYLHLLNTRFYNYLASLDYGKPIGEVQKDAVKQSLNIGHDDFYLRATSEEFVLNGDPAVVLNASSKPDYVIEDKLVKVSPSFVSIADASFKLSAGIYNIGKAINHNIVVQVTRQYPNQTSEVVYRDTIQGIKYMDSINVDIPINSLRDKGANKITVTVDADNQVDELYETNNSVTKEFFVYEDEARPVYPYNYSIVSKQNVKLVASTANAFSKVRNYRMEIDTTALFNSPLKATKNVTTTGGILEFDPGFVYKDSLVYFWRAGFVSDTGGIAWSPASSFVFLNNHDFGFNQSHKFQHLNSDNKGIYIDSTTGRFYYSQRSNEFLIRNAVFPVSGNVDPDFYVTINNTSSIGPGCYYNSLIFNVFDSLSLQPWQNNYSGSTGLYNSLISTCGARREFNFEYSLATSGDRKKAMDFLDLIPEGSYVIIRSNTYPDASGNTFSNVWKADTSLYGSNNSLYHKLLQQGFVSIDSFNSPRAFIFVFRKGKQNLFASQAKFSEGIYDKLALTLNINTPGYYGTITSPSFGPAKAWKEFNWKGNSLDAVGGDEVSVNIVGVRSDGSEAVIFNDLTPNQTKVDISSINANDFPYLKLEMSNKDSIFRTPYQLKNWQLTYDPVPEGALAPNIYVNMADTVAIGQNLDFKVAFKNISDTPFDSLKVKIVITNSNNVTSTLQEKKYKPLVSNDTLNVSQHINTQALTGLNTLYVEVNSDNDQPEQYHFNNFGYKNFYVFKDSLNPILDVTFDNVHILNEDIVSSKPEIIVKLKDESKWLLLDDESLVDVQVRYPNGSLIKYNYNSDTLNFSAASANAKENEATITFKPYFTEDGDYELIVTGKDKSGNETGNVEYRVKFKVINKPMISNMLNYPNPFTTSTAFVFTLTGSEVPQNIKIQVLTVTGKVVKEITKEELGPLHIGRNITEYKWNGTDQYGQKLGNGIYLYRVITNLNGKALEKYNSASENTDKYFNKGYGKMYLMR